MASRSNPARKKNRTEIFRALGPGCSPKRTAGKQRPSRPTTLMILHHVAIAHGGSGGWYWRKEPDASNRLVLMFNATNQAFIMGFFFLLAGYYMPGAYDRRGTMTISRRAAVASRRAAAFGLAIASCRRSARLRAGLVRPRNHELSM